MFQIGDKVRVKLNPKSSYFRENPDRTWYVNYKGKGGVIEDDEGNPKYGVRFNHDNDMWWYPDEDLESVSGKRGRPRTKAPKVNFLLKYDLDEDPIEEFETMEQVKERIDYLVKNESSLNKDSMVVYEVKRKKVVSVETKITMK